MAEELVFYTNPMSRGRMIRWMLEETGCDYRTEILEYGTTMKSPEYLAINPMGKVPAIVHRGHVVTEGAAICAYLADAFPAAGLAPPVAERHDYYRWLFYFAGAVEGAVTDRMLGVEIPPDRERSVGYGNYATVMNVVERRLSESPYIAGDAFTAADVYCGAQVGWGMQFGTFDKRPAFAAYWARLENRPAIIRAAELDGPMG